MTKQKNCISANTAQRYPSNTQGSVLVFALVALLMVTTLGITSLKDALVSQKIGSGFKYKSTAFQNAQNALRNVEITLSAFQSPQEVADHFANSVEYSPTPTGFYQNPDFMNTLPPFKASGSVTRRYIEHLGLRGNPEDDSQTSYYRITVLSHETGHVETMYETPKSSILLQSTFAMRTNQNGNSQQNDFLQHERLSWRLLSAYF